jgi:hypothetical protein
MYSCRCGINLEYFPDLEESSVSTFDGEDAELLDSLHALAAEGIFGQLPFRRGLGI